MERILSAGAIAALALALGGCQAVADQARTNMILGLILIVAIVVGVVWYLRSRNPGSDE